MVAPPSQISVSVVFALPDQQYQIELSCEPGTTLVEAIRQSGISQFTDGIDDLEFGVYGFRQNPDYPLAHGDRVEIYRALEVDPKKARMERVREARNQ